MRIFELTWTEFKADFIIKGWPFFYGKTYYDPEDSTKYKYELNASHDGVMWVALVQDSSDVTDFETNYKSKGNKCLFDDQGKEYQRAESRPLDCTTYFTTAGDSPTLVGEGGEFTWDFSNDDNIISQDSNFKTKRMEFKFLDQVNIKEGTLYFHKALKGSFVNFYVVCPAGYYYYDNNGTPRLATVDTPIARYLNKLRFQGDCPMGDEFNTETCSSAIPNYYKFWLEVTVPIADVESNGYILIEMYRKRTLVL